MLFDIFNFLYYNIFIKELKGCNLMYTKVKLIMENGTEIVLNNDQIGKLVIENISKSIVLLDDKLHKFNECETFVIEIK